MKREALVPIDEELRTLISQQHHRIRVRWPAGTPVLFPRPNCNIDGTRPVSGTTYREALRQWLTGLRPSPASRAWWLCWAFGLRPATCGDMLSRY